MSRNNKSAYLRQSTEIYTSVVWSLIFDEYECFFFWVCRTIIQFIAELSLQTTSKVKNSYNFFINLIKCENIFTEMKAGLLPNAPTQNQLPNSNSRVCQTPSQAPPQLRMNFLLPKWSPSEHADIAYTETKSQLSTLALT